LPLAKAPLTQVVWTFSALADLEGIRRYIGNFNPSAAQDMADRIIEAGNRLAALPCPGRQVPGTQLRETTIVRPRTRPVVRLRGAHRPQVKTECARLFR
jgi:plasmid stabilization system protein ParE